MNRLPPAAVRRPRLVAPAAALALPLAFTAIVTIELLRFRPSMSMLSRPDRLLGWNGAPGWPLLDAMAILAAVLLVALGLGIALTVPGRVAALAVVPYAAAGLGVVLVQLFPTDALQYRESSLRGIGAAIADVALPLAIACAGVALFGARRRLLGAGSLLGGIAVAWAALCGSTVTAIAGAAQPQLGGFVAAIGAASAWSFCFGAGLIGEDYGRRFGRRSRLFPGRGAARLLIAAAALAIATAGLVGAAGFAGYARLVVPVVAAQLDGRVSVDSIQIDGVTRQYRVYRPVHRIDHPGLVVVLHPVFGSGFQAEVVTAFDRQADRLGWIVAYPDGIADGWDALGSTAAWGRHAGIDDVAFIAGVIDRLGASDGTDPARVFVTGFSRGAMMTYRVGCELAGRVAAIAPVSGNMADAQGSATNVACTPARPVSVLAIHGTADGMIPIAGGYVGIPYAPMAEVVARWRTIDDCAGTPTVAVAARWTTTSWSCAAASAVTTLVIDGGGHDWPGAEWRSPLSPSEASRGSGADDASSVIADFFAAHPRLSR